jgi:hypothetical protein
LRASLFPVTNTVASSSPSNRIPMIVEYHVKLIAQRTFSNSHLRHHAVSKMRPSSSYIKGIIDTHNTLVQGFI